MSLELVPTDDLLMEVIRRFDHVVFAGMKTLREDGEGGEVMEDCRNSGNPRICQGMCVGLMAEIQCEVTRVSRDGAV